MKMPELKNQKPVVLYSGRGLDAALVVPRLHSFDANKARGFRPVKRVSWWRRLLKTRPEVTFTDEGGVK